MKTLITIFLIVCIAFGSQNSKGNIVNINIQQPPETTHANMLIDNNIVYLSAKHDLFIVDVSNIKEPRIINKITFSKLDYINEMAISGKNLYILTDDKLLLYNINASKHPILINSLNLKDALYDLHVFPAQKKITLRSKEDYTYYVISDDLKQIKKLNNSNLFGRGKVVYKKDYAFAIFDSSFSIIDISDISNPNRVNHVSVAKKHIAEIVLSDLLLSEDLRYGYAINGYNGLQIFDLLIKQHIKELGKLDVGSDNMLAFGFYDKNHIYGMLDDILILIDTSNKMKPKIITSIKGLGNIGYVLPFKKKLVAITDNIDSENTIYILSRKGNSYTVEHKNNIEGEIFDIKIEKYRLYIYRKCGLSIYEI